jgi:hypothetical protein
MAETAGSTQRIGLPNWPCASPTVRRPGERTRGERSRLGPAWRSLLETDNLRTLTVLETIAARFLPRPSAFTSQKVI